MNFAKVTHNHTFACTMQAQKKVKSALISVFYKDGLEPIIKELNKQGVAIYSTGGTQKFIEELGGKPIPVETITNYPSILEGRVKTLHPAVFGGILARRENVSDLQQLEEYDIPEIDLVIVDLYPFEETVKSGAEEQEIIEKIDIGGISLIRAAAKNFKDTVIIASKSDYTSLLSLLQKNGLTTTLEDRKNFAAKAFDISSHYDTAIYKYFTAKDETPALKISVQQQQTLRYGENPHQKGSFFGDLDVLFDQLNGKELSYNNLLDIDAAVNLLMDFKTKEPVFIILKHNNACGVAMRPTLIEAWKDALAGDPISAFGGILITNKKIDLATATEINKLFCEVVIANGYNPEALTLLKSKKNRIILLKKDTNLSNKIIRTALNGILVQDKDQSVELKDNYNVVTDLKPSASELSDLEFANIISKHTKSNTIVIVKNNQLLGSGTGQTSRVDALKQAIHKAKTFKFKLNGAVMASDAFFPFPDCVEIAGKEGIKAVVQPGGSIKDQASIDYCNGHNISMVFTGKRHFKH